MIDPWLASQIALKRQQIVERGHVLNYADHADFLVQDIALIEPARGKSYYLATFDNGETQKLTRVSHICDLYDSAQFISWEDWKGPGHCKRVREEALAIGNEVHEYARVYVSGGSPLPALTTPEARHCARLARAWWDEVKPLYEVLAQEFTVWNCVGGWAGTVDLALRYLPDGGIHTRDFKTAAEVGTHYRLQQGAYEIALGWLTPQAPSSCALVMLPKPGQAGCETWHEERLWIYQGEAAPSMQAFAFLNGTKASLEQAQRTGGRLSGLPLPPDVDGWWADRPEMTDAEVEALF